METPVTIENKNGNQLVGILNVPGNNSPSSTVIICHGLGGTKTKKKFVRLARRLEKNNIACLRFDFEGCGDSQGKFEKTTLENQVADLESVVDWLSQKEWFSKEKLDFIGHSLGCLVISLYLSKNDVSVNKLVFLSPAFNPKVLIPLWNTPEQIQEWKQKGYILGEEEKMGIEFLKENEDRDYSSLLANISANILVIHGEKDRIVPAKLSQKLVENFPHIKLNIYSDIAHEFENYFTQQKLVKEATEWIIG